VVNYHAKTILTQAKVSMDSNLATVIIGICQMGGNVLSACIVDKTGRKTLLYISSVFLCLSQTGLGLYFYFDRFEDLSSFRWAPLILLITFVIALPVGWGSVTYILVAELVPTQIRTETAVLCDAWGQLLQFVALRLHDMTCADYGAWVLHAGFATTTLLSIGFTFLFLPETSGKSLEEIETFFTHLRREAMDMVGDRAACRIPEVKGPLFKISISKSRRESMDFTEAVMQEKPAGNKDTLTGKTERERKRSLIKTEPSREIP